MRGRRGRSVLVPPEIPDLSSLVQDASLASRDGFGHVGAVPFGSLLLLSASASLSTEGRRTTLPFGVVPEFPPSPSRFKGGGSASPPAGSSIRNGLGDCRPGVIETTEGEGLHPMFHHFFRGFFGPPKRTRWISETRKQNPEVVSRVCNRVNKGTGA